MMTLNILWTDSFSLENQFDFNIIKTAGDVPVSTGRNDFCVQWSGDLITDTTTSAKKPVLFHAPALSACAA